MKNSISILTSMLLISLILVSCENEDNEDKKNYLRIGETEYNLSSGLLDDNGPYRDVMEDFQYDGYNLDLKLVSSGITISTDEGLSGTGLMIAFEMFSSEEGKLSEGTYVYEDTKPYSTGTYDWAVYLTNWPLEESSNDEWVNITGKVAIERNGSEYEIDIDCTDKNGKSIKGYYKGNLHYYKNY